MGESGEKAPDGRPYAEPKDIEPMGPEEFNSYLANAHPKFARIGGAFRAPAQPSPAPAAPAAAPAAPADTRIDPRTVKVEDVNRMTREQKAHYIAALKGHDGPYGAPETGIFRPLTKAEAAGTVFGRDSSPQQSSGWFPQPDPAKAANLPEGITRENVHKLTPEQRAALVASAGLNPNTGAPQRVHKPGETVVMFKGQKGSIVE